MGTREIVWGPMGSYVLGGPLIDSTELTVGYLKFNSYWRLKWGNILLMVQKSGNLVFYPIICKVLLPSQVVVWDFLPSTVPLNTRIYRRCDSNRTGIFDMYILV